MKLLGVTTFYSSGMMTGHRGKHYLWLFNMQSGACIDITMHAMMRMVRVSVFTWRISDIYLWDELPAVAEISSKSNALYVGDISIFVLLCARLAVTANSKADQNVRSTEPLR